MGGIKSAPSLNSPVKIIIKNAPARIPTHMLLPHAPEACRQGVAPLAALAPPALTLNVGHLGHDVFILCVDLAPPPGWSASGPFLQRIQRAPACKTSVCACARTSNSASSRSAPTATRGATGCILPPQPEYTAHSHKQPHAPRTVLGIVALRLYARLVALVARVCKSTPYQQIKLT